MARIIAVNGFHQGAGASTIAANVAVVLAQRGRRVGLIDACISAPTQHLLFELPDSKLPPTFDDFLLGRCDLPDAARGLPADTLRLESGRLFLVPADPGWGEMTRALEAPYSVDVLSPALQRLADALQLDTLLIDGEAGLDERALAALAASDTVLAVAQLDRQQYHGLGLTLGVAGEFYHLRRALVVNSASPTYAPQAIKQAVEQGYGLPVAGVVPYCAELAALCSAAIFVVRYPEHEVSKVFGQIADFL